MAYFGKRILPAAVNGGKQKKLPLEGGVNKGGSSKTIYAITFMPIEEPLIIRLKIWVEQRT